MLEIDLLKGGSGRGLGERPRLASPGVRPWKLSRDGWIIGCALTILVSLGLAAYSALSVRNRAAGLEEALAAALADSVRSATLIEKMRTLEARRDSIAARAAIIQGIDARRYLWPRIMDEVAGVLPAQAWLTRFAQVASQEDSARFVVEGMTHDNFSLTRFWNGMESSPFIRNVRLISTENVAARPVGGAGGDLYSGDLYSGDLYSGDLYSGDLYYFVLQAEPEDPPPEMLDFVPVRPVAAR